MSLGSGNPYYQEPWFEGVFLVLCAVLGYVLFWTFMPPIAVSGETLQNVAMAKLLAEGRWLDAISHFNTPPVYPALLALMIKLKHPSNLSDLLEQFKSLNLLLYLTSGGLVHWFARRQIHKPYIFAITLLYMVAPLTLNLAWVLDAQMAYMTISLATVLAIDISLSADSVLGGLLSRREVLLCGTLLGLSILTLQVGYTLLLAFFIVVIKRFGIRKSASIVGVVLLAISPFVARDLFYAMRSPQPYVQPSITLMHRVHSNGIVQMVEDYADQAVYTIAHRTVGELNLHPLDNFAHTPQVTTPSQFSISQKTWGRWLLAFIALVGAFYGMRAYTGVGAIYLCTFMITALILLPQSAMSLGLILPLSLFYLFYGICYTGMWSRRINIPISRVIGPVLTAWILLCSVTTLLAQAHGSVSLLGGKRTPRIMYMSTAQEPENRLELEQTHSSHRRAMDWLDTHTAETARIGAARGNVPAVDSSQVAQQQWQHEVAQYDFLVEEGSSKIAPLKSTGRAGDSLKLVYEDVPGRIRIWEVNPGQVTSATN